MEIKSSGSRPSGKGPAEYFTGAVRIDPIIEAPEPARVRAASVTFEPGARTAWHTHPLGQTLIVTSGLGWAQLWGGPIEEIRPGDVVWISPGEKHWHGATPATAMTHIAISGSAERQPGRLDGKGQRRAVPARLKHPPHERVEAWRPPKLGAVNAAATRKEPGCLRFDVLVLANDPNPLFLYEAYESEAAFRAHRDSTANMVAKRVTRTMTALSFGEKPH